jgi:hypothetical protein
MIAEQTVLKTQTPTVMTRTSRAPASRRPLTAMRSSALALSHAVISWIRIGALPYATLWEASLVVDLLAERDIHQPDAFSRQMPSGPDSWLRG